MTKKSTSAFVRRYEDVLQLGAALLFLLLVAVYASVYGASLTGLSSASVGLLVVAAVLTQTVAPLKV